MERRNIIIVSIVVILAISSIILWFVLGPNLNKPLESIVFSECAPQIEAAENATACIDIVSFEDLKSFGANTTRSDLQCQFTSETVQKNASDYSKSPFVKGQIIYCRECECRLK